MNKSNGARYEKLKLAYKKAIQEILDKESIITQETPQADSFFNSDTSKVNTVNTKEKFLRLKEKLSDLFKNKIKEYDLESKLDLLNQLIKDNVVSNRDIKDKEYIKEILESYIVEEKAKAIEYVNSKIEELTIINKDLENSIIEKENELEELKRSCNEKEISINYLINDIKKCLKK